MNSPRSRWLLSAVAGAFVALGMALPAGPCRANDKPGAKKEKDEASAQIALPKDPKAVVLSYDPGAGGFIRKGPPPYLEILANGQVTVTNLHTGMKKESKLTDKELKDLVKFVVDDQSFLQVTADKINDGIKEASKNGPFIAVGGAGTSVIAVQLSDKKKHEVSYRGASAYLQTYPKVVPLARYVAVEKRLSDLGLSIEKAK